MSRNDELEGRLAAIEKLLTVAFHSTAMKQPDGAYPRHVHEELERAITEFRSELSSDAAAAAEETLRRVVGQMRSSL